MSPPLPILPISDALPALAAALASNRAAVLHAPPGAGKSTIVPLALLPLSFVGSGKILMLEPRRLAARAVANRMAQLLGQSVGERVGYRTRLDSKISRNTRIEVITEGILTRLLQEDPSLDGVSCVLFDEFHERSLNADLGLALTLESQEALRPDLKILVMSATLDTDAVAALLGAAPVISSEGRSFDVDTIYVARREELHLELQMAQVVRIAMAEHAGDVLCFLPGAAEIRRVQKNLESMNLGSDIDILPLYGDLPAAAQDAALARAAAGRRKIVIATSIAETSLTIDGVRIIVDSGLRRFSQFDPVTGMSRLETGKISQAAADQRRGRAGRLNTGVCFRLWSQSVFASLAAQTSPEILHADLAPLALDLACWGANDANALHWLDAPPAAPLAQAKDLLRQLDALDEQDRVTAHGRQLARVGAHPRLAHMLMRAKELDAVDLACDLAAILSERDILRAAPGARDADIRLRTDIMHSGARGSGRRRVPAQMNIDERALTQARQSASAWRRQFTAGKSADIDTDEMAGILLAFAYPDRIGRRRGDGGRYLLANGRGAVFTDAQVLTKSDFIVAAEVDGADREARIYLAAPLHSDAIEKHFADHIRVFESVGWDSREHAVKALREVKLGALTLDAKPISEPDEDALIAAVLQGLRLEGIAALPWTDALRQWQARVQLMRGFSTDWPDLSDAALLESLAEWAPQWLDGITRRSHFSRIDLDNALRSRLSFAQSAAVDRDVPTHFTAPSGSNIPIDYLDGGTPSISARLQEMFGLLKTPTTAAGRVPLLLKLLSPAGRPVQITRDLISFWDRGYHEVKKDLKGRYPKHYWPDDPHTAVATRRKTRPR